MIEKPVSAPPPGGTPLGLWRGMLLFAPLLLLGNFVGASLRYPDIGSAVVFPPYAVLTAALLLSPRRDWGWYALAHAVTHFAASWPHWSLSWVLVSDVANITRAAVAATMLRWAFRRPLRLDDVPDLARFALAAAIIAPSVGATIGAMNVVLHGAPATYWRTWTEWFVSNALTGLTILPACIVGGVYAAQRRFPRPSRARVVEGAAIAVGLVLSGAVAFLIPAGVRWQVALRLYAPLPVLIWTALRFGTGAVSLGLTAVTLGAVWTVDRDAGLFGASTPDQNVLVLQLFVLLTAVPVLCIAAVSGARRGVAQLHRALLASLHDHVAILDSQGAVVEVNDSWRRWADTAATAAFQRVGVGGSYVDACRVSAERGDSVAPRALAGVSRVLNREVTRVEMEYDDHLNGRRRFALSIEALERGDGGAVVTRADVTARHEARLQIEEQRRELSHLARVTALGQLSGALAHELNQPLTSICSNAEAARHLLRRRPVDLPEIDAVLGDILAEDQRAAQVIRRLRALLRPGEARVLPLDAAELVNEVLELAHAELITRAVSATAAIGLELPPVLADRVQLQQVLLNLILNACEAMQAVGAPRRRLSLTVAGEGASHVRFSVRDSGTGIPASLTDHLFEPFVTTKKEGLGLGLSISRTIVAAHGGRMWAENNPDGGATVHCLFPAAAWSTDREREPDAGQDASNAGGVAIPA
jgi:two-component system, LuxR family, sensor kinase FixL